MPFTPFHLGVGAICKAGLGDRFSFMVFGGAQVLMDIEPGVKLLTGSVPLHGPTHTAIGAFGIAVLATVTGKPLSEFTLRLCRVADYPISWSASAIAAFLGTFSHIVLDAVMHADMVPWYPFWERNNLLDLMGMESLHLLCLGLGILGGIGVWIRYASSRVP